MTSLEPSLPSASCCPHLIPRAASRCFGPLFCSKLKEMSRSRAPDQFGHSALTSQESPSLAVAKPSCPSLRAEVARCSGHRKFCRFGLPMIMCALEQELRARARRPKGTGTGTGRRSVPCKSQDSDKPPTRHSYAPCRKSMQPVLSLGCKRQLILSSHLGIFQGAAHRGPFWADHRAFARASAPDVRGAVP